MKYPRSLCEEQIMKSLSFLKDQNPSQALEAANKARAALEHMERDIGDDVPPTPVELKELWGNIEHATGMAMFHGYRMEEAAGYLRKAVASFEDTQNENLPNALANLGIIYRHLNEPDESLKCYEKAISIFQARGDELNLALILQNAGNTCQTSKRNEDAMRYFAESKEGFERLGMQENIGEVEIGIGCTLAQMEDYERAKQAYLRARRIFEMSGRIQRVARVDTNIAVVEVSQGHLEKAIDLLEGVRSKCRDIKDTQQEYITASQFLAKIFMQLGRLEDALKVLGQLVSSRRTPGTQ